jgi:DNA repair photolyase
MNDGAAIKRGVPAPGMGPRLGGEVDRRRGVQYRALRAASLLNRVNDRPMPFGWSVNPYRGCEMACRYCYARYTHDFLGLNDPGEFERTIYVKEAEAGALVADLRRARRSGLAVALGTATDPYQPAEAVHRITRRVLEAARHVPGLELSITTKSPLVMRDLDLLGALAADSRISVNVSITTPDAALARRLEPRAPRPDLRLQAVAVLARAGVRACVFAMPILPYLTDGEASLRRLLEAARAAGAAGVAGNALFLRAGTRETFLAFLAAEFPALVSRYLALYRGSAYPAPAYRRALAARFRALRVAAGFREDADAPEASAPPRRPRQLALVW